MALALLLLLLTLFLSMASAEPCHQIRLPIFDEVYEVEEGSVYRFKWHLENLNPTATSNIMSLIFPAGTSIVDISSLGSPFLSPLQLDALPNGGMKGVVRLGTIDLEGKLEMAVEWLLESSCTTGPDFTIHGVVYQDEDGKFTCSTEWKGIQVSHFHFTLLVRLHESIK